MLPRLIIAGTQSGVGKTTIVTGLLAALSAAGHQVQPYKVGPDYIDPGYHQLACGRLSHNLDTWLMPEDKLVPMFAKTAAASGLALIEGVMGLYDGGRKGVSSTAAIAKLLSAPVVLVIDARSMGESAAAIALGYKLYDPDVNLAGVILNRLGSKTHEEMIRQALEKMGIPVLGAIYRNELLKMPERHLGLTPVAENDVSGLMDELKQQISSQVDLAALLKLAQSAPALSVPAPAPVLETPVVRIGVAQDEAFSFYYPESLEVLQAAGAELVFFSPLYDQQLPDVDGLLLGGGFPEMFAGQLAANTAMLTALRAAHQRHMPIYAECGGFMYLTESLFDFEGRCHQLAGIIPASCRMTGKLQTVGYIEAVSCRDNILCHSGAQLRGHEFHFSRMDDPADASEFPWAFTFKKARTGAVYPGGYAFGNVLASYLHLHFSGHSAAAMRFIETCLRFKESTQAGKEGVLCPQS